MKIPLPGQFWYEQHAHYAGIATDGKKYWHLLVPPENLTLLPLCHWGEVEQEVATKRFDGYANTLLMAEAGSKLAKVIRELPNDCYLFSQAEAALCSATMPQVFQPGYHWTSTQSSRRFAYVQDFEYSDSDWYGKDSEFRAVAVRRIIIGE